MREKTCSFLILFFAFIGALSYFLMSEKFGLELEQRRTISYIFEVAIFLTFSLLIMKILSRFGAPNDRSDRLSSLEALFMLYYFFLTKEAREEWRSCIARRKAEESKSK